MNTCHGPAALLASTRADLLRLRRWPAMWVMLAVGLSLDVLFGYVFNYISYRSDSNSQLNEGMPAELILQGLLPAGVPQTTLSGMPMFGGAILLILGALAIGSGFGWGTWKTILTQGPSRASVYGGAVCALAVIVITLVTVTFAVNFGLALLIGGIESQPLAWPPAVDVAQAYGGGLLIYGMWTAGGVLVGVLARSPALAVGLGLVWALAVENLLRGVANVLEPLEALTDLLPGTAAGSLAGALGATPFSDEGTPGVLSTIGGGPAALLLAAFIVLFATIAGLLITRRDTF